MYIIQEGNNNDTDADGCPARAAAHRSGGRPSQRYNNEIVMTTTIIVMIIMMSIIINIRLKKYIYIYI